MNIVCRMTATRPVYIYAYIHIYAYREHFFPFISVPGKGVNIDLLCYYRCTFCHRHCRRLGGGMNLVQPIWLSAAMTHHVRRRPPPSESLTRGRPPVRPRNRSDNIIYLSLYIAIYMAEFARLILFFTFSSLIDAIVRLKFKK